MKQQRILLGALALAVLVYAAYAFVQPVYTYAKLDPRFDAHQYARAYQYFKNPSSQYAVSFPFNARILSPWLAAQLPSYEAVAAFRWLNGFFLVLAIGLLVHIWQRLVINNSLIFIGLFWILFHWKGPLRMYLPDPISADVLGYFLGAAWLFLVLFRNKPTTLNYLIYGAIGFLSALQKESFIVVAGATWLFFVVKKQNATLFLVAFLTAIGSHFWADWAFAAPLPNWRNFAPITVLRGLKRYYESPELLLRLPVSWLLAYGFFWLGLTFKTPKIKTEQTEILAVLALIWLVLSIVGGGDTVRIFVNGLPFVLTYLLISLNQKPPWVGYFVLFASLPLTRLDLLEPDLGLYPQQTQYWCVECWNWVQSWPYWTYAAGVLMAYRYFARRFATL